MSIDSQLFELTTGDRIVLPGLIYSANSQASTKSRAAAIYLHGTGGGSIFYRQSENLAWAKSLARAGIDFVTFNNRGANIIKRHKWFDDDGQKQYALSGCAYELIDDCVIDIDRVVRFLKTKGYKTFYLIGHSTGANKIVVYHKQKKAGNPFSAYVLLAGGDDTGLWRQELGVWRFTLLLRQAERKVAYGDGKKIVNPRHTNGQIFSWQALLDMFDPEGAYNVFPFWEALEEKRFSKKELFGEFKLIDKPSLVVYGSQDEYCYGRARGCVNLLKKAHTKKAPLTYDIIAGADHAFTDKLDNVSRQVADFLADF